MKRYISLFILLSLLLSIFQPSISKEAPSVHKKQNINKGNQAAPAVKKQPIEDKVTLGSEDELIPVNVRNDFDEEIKVKLDTNREYPVGSHESITLGKRKPGRYTLTIYNKKGEFVDNLTRSIDKRNRFILNNDTVSNSNKITGLSTGQKVAITAGAIGAAALGTALIKNALQKENNQVDNQNEPPPQEIIAQQVLPVGTEQTVNEDNAFATGGKAIKFLNIKYDQITLVVEGTDGNPIGNNWIIPKGSPFQKPQPLIFNGETVTVSPEQKLTVVLPSGVELVRNIFELDTDPIDGSYVWIVK